MFHIITQTAHNSYFNFTNYLNDVYNTIVIIFKLYTYLFFVGNLI